MRLRLVMALLAMSLLLVPTVDAQTELERARDSVTATTSRLEAFLEELEQTQRRGNDLAGTYWQVESDMEKLTIEIAASEGVVADLDRQRGVLLGEVRVIALDRYMSSGDTAYLDHASDADRRAAQALAEVVVGADQAAIDRLAAVDEQQRQVTTQLESQRVERQARLAEVEQTQRRINDELARLVELRLVLDQELADLEAALVTLELAEAQRQAEAAAAAEQDRIEQERQRAERVAAAARRLPPPAPTAQPESAPTVVPNPQPAVPFGTATVDADPEPGGPTATVVPNPQPAVPFGTATVDADPEPGGPTATVVPNPQPAVPFGTATVDADPEPGGPTATVVPNPQPAVPFGTATAEPNPAPSAPLAPSGGGIVCPLAGPFTHTDDFNSPRAVGGVHRANDLIAASGTPVRAAASGELQHKNSSVGGLSAHLRGDNGDYYFYTHLSGYESQGAGWVAAGTIIGYVGMTGNAPIPHLHFEIHRGGYGNYANPYQPVRSACFS